MSQPRVYIQHPAYNQPIPAEYFTEPVQVQASTIITQPVTATYHSTPVGQTPSRLICPSCRADIVTSVKYEPSTKTHLVALCLFIFICWPCVCLPYCMNSCQNANHYCPNCNAYIGTYQN